MIYFVQSEGGGPINPVQLRDIPGFPGYRLGDDASVWSCRNHGGRLTDRWHRVKPDRDKTGYLRVRLSRTGGGSKFRAILLHRLVLETFVGPCPPGHEASHYPDPDRTNCHLNNLRWETRKANHAHKREHGSLPMGEGHHKAVLTDDLVRMIRRLAAEGMGRRAIARRLGVARTTLTRVLDGITWKHVP